MSYEHGIPMRSPRLKGPGPSCFYHCLSRITGGECIFETAEPGSEEAEHFVRLMRDRQW
jgi:hypothetical protein